MADFNQRARRGRIAATLVVAAGAVASSLMLGPHGALWPDSAAAAKRYECGTVSGVKSGVALYDVRSKNVECRTARRVAKRWRKKVLGGDCMRFKCRAKGFWCRAKPPAEVHYTVKCKRSGGKRVRWEIHAD